MDQLEVRRIEVALRQAGWAEHARLDRECRNWDELAKEVNNYTATVDDYTNNLFSRDYIAEAVARASEELRAAIGERTREADRTFRDATVADDDKRLARYFRVDFKDGWWWHRRPSSGALAEYLADSRSPSSAAGSARPTMPGG